MARSIVLLSDGTGNAAGKLFRTNVWRFYQALDLSSTAQVARYDDGVGSSSVKLLALLAGAVGWGLKRNLIDLYMFLCRNYQAGDPIYCIGFSRGAFTVRVLARFVLSQGLVADFNSEDDLRRKARKLYGEFRRTREHVPLLTRLARAIREPLVDWPREMVRAFTTMIRKRKADKVERKLEQRPDDENLRAQLAELMQDPWAIATTRVPDIRFVGVWDTVDAYGLPIHELKKGIDRYIWPMHLEDCDLHERIGKACHALSIDDQRSTFHPLLWDEKDEKPVEHTDLERLTQVWFAGVHANLGGGYPDDGLSYVSLRWMVNEAGKQELKFKPGARAEIDAAAAPYGRMYDSRAGLGAYYRYDPRRLEAPMDHQNARVGCPKIHESVIWRMAAGTDAYAPLSLPKELRIVSDAPAGDHPHAAGATDANVPPPNIHSFTSYQDAVQAEGQLFGAAADCPTHQRRQQTAGELAELKEADDFVFALIWDTVWWRRVAHLVTLMVTLVLGSLPWLPLPWNLSHRMSQSGIGQLAEPAAPLLNRLTDAAMTLSPWVLKPWIEKFVTDPIGVTLLAVMLLACLAWGRSLDRAIRDRALAAWNAKWRSRRREWLRGSLMRRAKWAAAPLYVSLLVVVVLFLARNEVASAGAALCDAAAEACRSLARPNALMHDLAMAGFAALGVAMMAYYYSLSRKSSDAANAETERRGLSLSIANRMRSCKILCDVYQRVTEQVLPAVFALLVVYLAVAGVSRTAFALMSAAGAVCSSEATGGLRPIPDGGIAVSIGTGCHRTGVKLEVGTPYRIEIVDALGWRKDWSRHLGPLSTADGYGVAAALLKAPVTTLLVPFRRKLAEDWLTPIVRIGPTGADEHIVRWGSATIRPRRSGELFFYVNDAVIGVPGLWSVFYAGNRGTGTLRIIPDTTMAASP
jgi:uncharacterized protein (DUF2235 family)